MLNAQKGRFRKMKTKHECLTGKLLQVSFRAEGTRVGLYKDTLKGLSINKLTSY